MKKKNKSKTITTIAEIADTLDSKEEAVVTSPVSPTLSDKSGHKIESDDDLLRLLAALDPEDLKNLDSEFFSPSVSSPRTEPVTP